MAKRDVFKPDVPDAVRALLKTPSPPADTPEGRKTVRKVLRASQALKREFDATDAEARKALKRKDYEAAKAAGDREAKLVRLHGKLVGVLRDSERAMRHKVAKRKAAKKRD